MIQARQIHFLPQKNLVIIIMYHATPKPLPQNQIPKVKTLCEELGFGHSYDRLESSLKESTQLWRKQFKTKDGIPGMDLTNWRSVQVQNDLTHMTKEYLSKGGYGFKYWPPKGDLSPNRIPEYPKDQHR